MPMKVPTTPADADPAIMLRPMTTADIAGGLRLCRASGWNQVARDWQHFLAVNEGGARVLEKDGVVVGTVCSLRYGPFAWLAMVLVDPPERGRGLGSRVVAAGLDLLADVPAVRLDATAAGERIYRVKGFAEEGRLSRMTGTAPAIICPDQPSTRPMTADDLPHVAEWDRGLFGASRRTLLDWLFAGAPEYAWIAVTPQGIAGYALGRHGHAFDQLGPIVALTVDVAAALASACLNRHAGRPFIIDATRRAPEWIRWLERVGFSEARTFIRMARPVLPFGRPELQFASAGPELG
jgi:GNAT superfamily N-acetyltransferase